MQKITPYLWFNNNAHEAMNFYTSIFKNSKVETLSPMVSTFELDGQKFMALNGGPMFKFTEAVSFLVNCDTQNEVDNFWEKLSEGGAKSQCGWLKDKYGLSWQIVPSILMKLMSDPDPEKTGRVMQAIMKMQKIEIKLLEEAYNNK